MTAAEVVEEDRAISTFEEFYASHAEAYDALVPGESQLFMRKELGRPLT